MPIYNKSKSQKRSSQSQSKNGGRRRKNTMRKLRRGRKSRKVIRGGKPTEYSLKFPGGSQLVADLLTKQTIENKGQLEDYIFNPINNINAKMWYKQLYKLEPDSNMSNDDIKDAIIKKLEEGDQ